MNCTLPITSPNFETKSLFIIKCLKKCVYVLYIKMCKMCIKCLLYICFSCILYTKHIRNIHILWRIKLCINYLVFRSKQIFVFMINLTQCLTLIWFSYRILSIIPLFIYTYCIMYLLYILPSIPLIILFIYLSYCLSIYLTVYLSILLSIFLSYYLSRL